MSLNIRTDGDLAVLSNVARLMNDPRYSTAGADLDPLLDQGIKQFAIELAGVNETGSALMGFLMTLTRRIRAAGADVVLIRCSPAVSQFVEEMQLDDYWELLPALDEAHAYFARERDQRPETNAGD
jgi:anti-anti-sigma regulatory factor